MSWPTEAKLRLLTGLRSESWRATARAEQLPPPESWRTWYIRGGRGSGKTRAGGETLADLICAHLADGLEGDWAIIAPTFGDARDTCMEGESGLLRALEGIVDPRQHWNRSQGVLFLPGGSRVYCDGGDDGALRIQGKNLRGVWCDEIGLWQKWELAWRQSIFFAVRKDPAVRICTGTPKMGHPFVKLLLDDPKVAKTLLRTADNVANLAPSIVDELVAEYGGTRLGRQELDGEYIEAIEGEILKRGWWRFYPLEWLEHWEGPAPQRLLCSWDTATKEKTSSDYTVGSLWLAIGANRYLLRIARGRWSLPETKTQVRQLAEWGELHFPRLPMPIIVENAATGPEVVSELRDEVAGILAKNIKGKKIERAIAVSPIIESGNVLLPGKLRPDGEGPTDPPETPLWVHEFVDECALFTGTTRDAHDDQVDSMSQALLELRGRPSLARGEQPEQVPMLTGGLLTERF